MNIDFLKLIRLLLKRCWIIIACVIFTALMVVLFTKNMPKEYQSTSSIYTGIYSSETATQYGPDKTARYAFDNLLNIVKSRETLKEVGLRLMASHMVLKNADPKIISAEHLEIVRSQVPNSVQNLIGSTEEETYQNLVAASDTNPFLVSQVNYTARYYSISALSRITVKRVMNSDIVALSYTCDDQGVCQKTLEIIVDVCIKNFRKLNESQTDKLVEYFEEQLKITKEQLKLSEEKYLQFKKANNLVNYDIQTGNIIAQREAILNQINRERETILATEAGIQNIESQLGGSQAQSFKNKDIMEKRQRIGQLTSQLTIAEMNNVSSEQIANLQLQINQVSEELKKDLEANSVSPSAGVSNNIITSEYFNRIVIYEESKARLKALENRRTETLGQYTAYVPLGDTLKRIQREIDLNEKAYLTTYQNLSQSKMRQQDQQSLSAIQIIDKPNYPLVATPSKRKFMVMLGGVIGGMVPITVIFLMVYFDKNIKTPQRAEQATGLRIGGIYPNVKRLQSYNNAEQVNNGLCDTILKNLYLTDNQHHQQRVLIISTRPSEGKTTISNLLCERLIQKGKKCLIVVPYLDSGSWSVVSYKVDNAFYQSRTEDLVPVERLNNTDILILELPSLILNDYPVALIKQFNIAFLICDANREWTKADQTALDSFMKVSGIVPQLILNDVEKDIVEEILGRFSKNK